MKIALLFLAFASIASTSFAAGTCTVDADAAVGASIGHAVGYDCPIVIVKARAGSKLELIDGKNGMCRLTGRSSGYGGFESIGLTFDADKQDTQIGDGCSIRVTSPSGETGLLEVAAVET